MSIKVMSWVWEHAPADISSSELLTLLALADFSDDEGCNIYPSMATLARKIKLSEDQARRVVHHLIELGYLQLVQQGGWSNGRNRSNEYQLVLDGYLHDATTPRRGKGEGTRTMQPPSPRSATPRTRADASTVLAPVQDDPSLEPSFDPPLLKAAADARIDTRASAAAAAEKPDMVWTAWTQNMPGTLTPILVDQLNDLRGEYSDPEIVRAIGVAVTRNARNLGYVRGVLQKGLDNAKPPPQEAGPVSDALATRAKIERDAARTAAKYGAQGAPATTHYEERYTQMDTNQVLPSTVPHWAYGCNQCRYGYVYAPTLRENALLPLYLQRAIQASNGDIEFCTCRAGLAVRAGLRHIWAAELKTRPDLDAIRANVKDKTPVPTIHYEQVEGLRPVTAGGAAYA